MANDIHLKAPVGAFFCDLYLKFILTLLKKRNDTHRTNK